MTMLPELPDPWPFDQPPGCAVFTTSHVLRGGQPITHVYHDADDHGWQFHYSGDKTTADAMVVALQEICLCDPTVVGIADLPRAGELSEKVQVSLGTEKSTSESVSRFQRKSDAKPKFSHARNSTSL